MKNTDTEPETNVQIHYRHELEAYLLSGARERISIGGLVARS